MAELSLGSFSPVSPEYRFGGTVHPNLQAANLALLIVSCMWLQRSCRGLMRAILAAHGAVACFFMLLTGSRTSLAVLFAAMLYSIVICTVRARGLFAVLLAALTVVSAGGVLLLFDALSWDFSLAELSTQLVAADRDLGDPTQLTGRVDLWHAILDLTSERVWQGWGFDAFWSPARIAQISEDLQWQINQSHNIYLEVLANLGVVGLTLYALCVVGALRASMIRFLSGRDVAGFDSAVLIMSILHGSLEAIYVVPSFPSYVLFSVLFRAGFR